MKDSRGKEIFIGDRVKVLCNFDNKIHEGDVFRVDRVTLTIRSMREMFSEWIENI